MSDQKMNFTTPAGRIVWGNLYTPQTKDADGKPLVIKQGPDAGKATQRYAFGVAIPKVPGQHWATYPRDAKYPDRASFGEAVWKVGHGTMGPAAQSPAFAWKIIDGDSTVPNRKGRKPCDQEGYPGHWILSFSGSFAPKLYNSDGSALLLEKDAIKPGYYVQVAGNVDGNASTQTPGVYLNPSLVSLQGYGPEIISGPDPTAAGFGGAPLPAGASATPVGAMPPVAAAGAPVGGAMPPLPPGAATPGTPPPPPATVAVAPNQAFVAGAGTAPFPPPQQPAGSAPPPPPAAPVRRMLPPAGSYTYEQMLASGWTDATLVANGMMAA